MTRSSLRVALSALFALPVAAQSAPSARLDAGTVRAGGSVANLPPAGGDVWGGFSALASGSAGSAHLGVQQSAGASAVDVQWQLGCQAVGQATSTSGASVRYAFAAPVAVSGQLSITWLMQSSGTGAMQLAIDLGDDGSVDATDSAVLPVTFGPAPLLVRVTASANASAGSFSAGWSTWHYSGSAQGALVLALTPDQPVVQVTSAACGLAPPSLHALPTFAGGLAFAGSCGAFDDVAVLALGLAAASIPLALPPGCVLGVSPDATGWQLPDAQRSVGWTLAVPASVRPIGLHAQLLGVRLAPFTVTTSPALRVVL